MCVRVTKKKRYLRVFKTIFIKPVVIITHSDCFHVRSLYWQPIHRQQVLLSNKGIDS